MCFNNSQSKNAEQIAREYGRKTDIIEAWKEIVEERRRNGEKIFDLTDGAYNVPAILSPFFGHRDRRRTVKAHALGPDSLQYERLENGAAER